MNPKFLTPLLLAKQFSGDFKLKVEIKRKMSESTCAFKTHFKNFENVEAVQQVFGEKTHEALSNLEVEFTDSTLYMKVDYDGRLLINPSYLESGSFTDIYLDVIHELVHVRQVMNGKNCNKALPYVERPLEIEAYRIAVDEARALGLDENRIIDYLDSDLINADELRQLATTLGINYEAEVLSESSD
jgi:hypothetical protein